MLPRRSRLGQLLTRPVIRHVRNHVSNAIDSHPAMGRVQKHGFALTHPLLVAFSLQNRVIQCEISNHRMQTTVLPLPVLEPARLVHSQRAVFLVPPVAGLIGYGNLFADIGDCLTLHQVRLRLAQLVNDPLRRMTIPRTHLPVLHSRDQGLTYKPNPGLFPGGRSGSNSIAGARIMHVCQHA